MPIIPTGTSVEPGVEAGAGAGAAGFEPPQATTTKQAAPTVAAATARAKIGRRPYGRRPIFARAVAAATVGAACFVVVACGGSKPAAPAPAPASTPGSTEVPVGIIGTHQLLKPECLPVHGRRWNFPGPQKISSNLYEMFAINYSCAEAKKWTQRLLRAQIPIKRSGNESELRGPKGYYCSAWPDPSGHAYAGGCQLKNNGDKAFGWNWNVLHRRVVFNPDENGVVHLEKLLGADAEVVLTRKGDHYVLDVHNTSGVGSIDRFSWEPPPGWTVTKITKTTGGNCNLSSKGVIWCSGKVQPPTCLCRGDGAILSIEFTANVPPDTTKHGHPLLFGSAGALLRIQAMTPVPYLIPGTPEAAKKQNGV